MKQGSTLFLKVAIVLMGIAAVVLCVFILPKAIGTVDQGGYDPILLGMYVTAIPFFGVLYQGWRLLNYIDKNIAFSVLSVKALKYIKYYASSVSGLYAIGMPYIYYVAKKDDAPGAVLIGLVLVVAPLVIAVFAAVLQKLLQNAIEIKSENDLTV